MRNLILRILINAVAILITAALLPGIMLADDGLGTLLLLGAIIGVVNALVRPFLILLTCPAVILSFGLFVLVINGLMLQLAATISGDRLIIDGFGWAVLGGIIMSLTALALETIIGMDDGYDQTRQDQIDRF
jgi:putative membrane protein